MGILRDIFGPSKDEMWSKLAREIRADFVDGSFWRGSKVVATHKQWTVTLDTFTVSTGKSSTTYTRMRAPYVNPGAFRFTVYRAGFFTPLGKFLGMQDIEIGARFFDEEFVIKGNDEHKVRRLLSNPVVREFFHKQPEVYVTVKDDEGWFGAEFPEGVDELYFYTVGVIKDVERLKQLYLLFAEILNQLCDIGEAYEHDPNVQL